MQPIRKGLWVVLVYKIPREPTSLRAGVWRKLKRLGAHLVHDAVWVLPATSWTREQFQWLAVEINELGGEAIVWESHILLERQNVELMEAFREKVEHAYHEILEELEREDADLLTLSRQYQQIKAQDYFQSELGIQVRERLLSARGGTTS